MPQDVDEMLPISWPFGLTMSSQSFYGIDLAMLSMMTGIPLVDLSIEFDDHIVRGTE